jgi:hypothetical protein
MRRQSRTQRLRGPDGAGRVGLPSAPRKGEACGSWIFVSCIFLLKIIDIIQYKLIIMQNRGNDHVEKLNQTCPYCGGAMQVERLRCSACSIAVEGKIAIPRLARLSVEHREFIELFVRSSGSLKAVAAKLGISYPTVRSRLDKVIAAIEQEEETERDARREILNAIEEGKLSVDEAIQLLRDL